ncbi:MAG: 3-hydroxyacyl-CoA dehydrogenase/enoyl-CoA hydratase family protein [Kofleriaceae bacterium]
MTRPIRRVAVLGAGVMGSGIAAHCANAGIPVVLLDIVPPDGKGGRNAFAKGALDKLKKAKPAAFMHPRNELLVTIGNFDDDLAKVADCDLIIEAIIEKTEPKRALFEKLEKLVQPQTIIASNTSGLRIAELLVGRSDDFKRHFMVTHFFNPPRYMKLLELVAGPETTPEAKASAEKFAQDLGKGIVWAKDTPNFIGNRIGLHSMMTTIHLMLEKGLAPEDVDNITGIPMGHPKSATFRTADVVGLDTVGHVAQNCYDSLTTDDERDVFKTPQFITDMIKKGILGDKTKGGFYKKGKDGLLTLDPKSGEYRPNGGNEEIKKATKSIGKIEDIGKRLQALIAAPGIVGEFAWTVLSRSLAYAARRIPEIADHDPIVSIDNAMKWGYNWDVGPFETWDALGDFKAVTEKMKASGAKLPAWIDKMLAANATGFYKDGQVWDPIKGAYTARETDPREVTWEVLRKGSAPVLKNSGAEAWDIGDGILGLTFKTKANSIDADVIKMIHEAVDRAERDFRGMVIWNQGEFFCVGANLFAVLMGAKQQQWEQLRTMIHGYQYATQKMKYSRVPVVAAPYNMTLGGGLELCMGASAVQAAAETYAGLVEVGVGLIPGGAGTMNMLWRALSEVPEGTDIDVYAFVTQTFKNIALAKVATSAEEAKANRFFRATDGVSFDRSRQLWEAKQKTIGLALSGYHPPTPRAYKLPGENGIATLQMLVNTLHAGKYASEHDVKISMKLANVLCGGVDGHVAPNTEDKMLELEREAFLSLCGEPLSQARMQAMLETQKPLRN